MIATTAIAALLELSLVMLPFARPVFESVSHFAWEWALLRVLAFVPFTVLELTKLARNRFSAGVEQ